MPLPRVGVVDRPRDEARPPSKGREGRVLSARSPCNKLLSPPCADALCWLIDGQRHAVESKRAPRRGLPARACAAEWQLGPWHYVTLGPDAARRGDALIPLFAEWHAIKGRVLYLQWRRHGRGMAHQGRVEAGRLLEGGGRRVEQGELQLRRGGGAARHLQPAVQDDVRCAAATTRGGSQPMGKTDSRKWKRQKQKHFHSAPSFTSHHHHQHQQRITRRSYTATSV